MKTKNNVIILSKKKIIGLYINYYTNNTTNKWSHKNYYEKFTGIILLMIKEKRTKMLS